jgi:RecJ-like exonuclease
MDDNDNPLAPPLVGEDVCPKCLGELDTGWECNSCGYDARPIVGFKCQSCDGTGGMNDIRNCPDCEGTGKTKAPSERS